MNKLIHEKFMLEALLEAKKAALKGEIPIGALIVNLDGEILARGHNLVESTFDITAHAEIIALRQISKNLKNWRLSNLSLYVTLEPCIMCCSALVLSRIKNIFYGCKDSRLGSSSTNLNILNNPNLPHQIHMEGGFCEDECRTLLQNFFKKLRNEKNYENKTLRDFELHQH